MKTEKNILIAFLLNVSFSIFEFFWWIFTGSVAILSDSIHDLWDALSIWISYFLEKKSKQWPDKNHTYWYIRYSVIGSVITTAILLFGSAFVIYQSILRIITPVEINYNWMIIFAIFWVVVNFVASYVTRRWNSLNQKSVNLHMLEDVLGWIVVLIWSILMKFTDITIIDPILSICVAVFILYHTIKNLREIVNIFLEKTPDGIDIDEIRDHILNVKWVEDVHHIHVRSIDWFNNFATLHVVVKEYNKEIKQKVKEELKEHNICHSTIELELTDENCENENCDLEHMKVETHHHHKR